MSDLSERVCKTLEGFTLLDLEPPTDWQSFVYKLCHIASETCKNPHEDWVQQFEALEATVKKAMKATVEVRVDDCLPTDEFKLFYSQMPLRAKKAFIRLMYGKYGQADRKNFCFNELCSFTADDFVNCPNFGNSTLIELRETLAKHGRKLKGDK